MDSLKNLSVLSIGLGGVLPPKGSPLFSGAFLRQRDYARHLKSYHVVTRTDIASHGRINPVFEGNLAIHPTNSSGRLDYLRKILNLGRSLIEKQKPDCLTCPEPWLTGFVALKLAREYRLPLDISLMSDMIRNRHFLMENFLLHLPGMMQMEVVLKFADSVRVSTDYEFQKLTPIYGSKVYVSKFYVDPAAYADAEKTRGEAENIRREILGGQPGFLVLSVGRLTRQKRMDILIRAAEKVVSGNPQVKFVIVGYGPEKEKLDILIRSLGLGNNVRLLGSIPNERIPAYYAACDLFAMTSMHEGTCMVLLEAALSGKPIAATAFAGARDLLGGIDGAVPCRINDPGEMAETISRMVAAPSLRRRMGEKLKSKALAEYDPEKISRQRVLKWSEVTREFAALQS